jgi:sialate O-acetylesterase
VLRASAAAAPAGAKSPGALFNGMVAALTSFPIRGVIACEGELDLDRAGVYRAIFAAQIQGWRAAWKRPELPFLFAQLASHAAPSALPVEDDWADLREAQAQVLRLPATAMAVTADHGDTDAMHPREKRVIAERLMLAALAVAHGRAMPHSGPVFVGHVIKDGAVHLRFQHAESGLRARASGPLLGFALAGSDQAFRWADARIEHDTIVVSHPAIPSPAAVRYAWESCPALSFENAAGLPAAPFRTDNWPRRPVAAARTPVKV